MSVIQLKPESPWTAERDARLRQLWPTGLSASKMAAELGGGLSRSAVLSHGVRQLKLPRRKPTELKPEKPRKPPKAIRRGHARKVPLAVPVQSPVFRVDGNVLTLLNAKDSHCRFMAGDVRAGELEICGAKVAKPGTSWCEFHRSRVYNLAYPPRIREPKFR